MRCSGLACDDELLFSAECVDVEECCCCCCCCADEAERSMDEWLDEAMEGLRSMELVEEDTCCLLDVVLE